MDDPRFASMHSAPIFKKIRKEKYETQVDDRFKDMLTEEKFNLGPGEKKKKKKRDKAVLGEEQDFLQEQEPTHEKLKSKSSLKKPTSLAPVKKETRLEYLNRLARGEISGSSSSSDEGGMVSDSESESTASSEDEAPSSDDGLGPLQIPDEQEIEEIEEATYRLAIQNCDWSNVRAEDLMVILQSFCSPGMVVKSVTVYPSDFGIQRMKEEAVSGPPVGLWSKKKSSNAGRDDDSSSSDSNDDSENVEEKKKNVKRKSTKKATEDDDIDNVALRAYELSKLRYYFAIAVFDSARSAEALYSQLDGIEFEHSAMVFDLRFVPDDVNFTQRTVRDTCSGVVTTSYKPPDFVVKALTHSNVECTWDLDDQPERARKLGNISSWRHLNESDLQEYLANSNSEDDGDNSDCETKDSKRKKKGKDMRKLLLGGSGSDDSSAENDDFFTTEGVEDGSNAEEEEETGNMSFSFIPGLKEDIKAQQQKMKIEAGLETPQEAAARRKEAKRALKAAASAVHDSESSVAEPVAVVSKLDMNKNKNRKNLVADRANVEPATSSELAALMGKGNDAEDESEEDYDMNAISKAERLRRKKEDRKRKKKNRGDETVVDSSSSFAVDTDDARFFPLLRNSSAFGIDPTSAEFKPTEGMNKILKEQLRLRRLQEEEEEQKVASHGSQNAAAADSEEDGSKRKKSRLDEVAPLVDRLKKKYGKIIKK